VKGPPRLGVGRRGEGEGEGAPALGAPFSEERGEGNRNGAKDANYFRPLRAIERAVDFLCLLIPARREWTGSDVDFSSVK